MKRSDALAPLSRDHHHALVLARELSRADENDVAPVGARFVGFLARHELAHFDLEESVLLPAVPREERGRLLARRLLHDHEFFRAAMRELRDSSGTATSGFLHELGARLRAHVQMEERELFPYLEEALSERELEEIGAAIRSRDATEDVGTVRGFLQAVTERDTESLLALSDPAIELHPIRLTGVVSYMGHDGMRRWIDDLSRAPAQVTFEVLDVQGSGEDRVIARVRLAASGEEIARVTAVFAVSAGKVAEVHGYISDDGLLAEPGVI